MQTGTFRFDGPRALELGYAPAATELVDLDHDGDLDLVVVNTGWFTGGRWVGSSFEIFLNPGDGYFETSTVYAAPHAPHGLAVCDVDGDGDPDLVTPDTAPDSLSVWLNDGAGVFHAGERIPVGLDPVDVVCLDLDGDGDLDLASADQFSFGVSVVLNAGGGSFGSPVLHPLGRLASGLEGGDPDGDGDADLLAFGAGTVVFLQNDGDGALSAFELTDLEDVGIFSRLCRIDGDEHPDLVSGSKIWFGLGDGLFDPAFVDTGLDDSPVRCCDFDEDGDLDVLSGTGIAVSEGDGTFAGLVALPPASDVGAVACGSFMGDRSPDLVRLHGTRAVSGGITLGFASLLPGPPGVLDRHRAGDSVWKIAAGQVDRDEHLDLIVGNVGTPFPVFDDGSIAYLAGNGDGTFDPLISYPAGNRARALGLADVDGDADLDAVVGNFDDAAVRVVVNDGTGDFDAGGTHPAGERPEALAFGDVDGRNGLDMVVGNHVDPGTLSVLLEEGAGGYAEPATYDLPGDRPIDLVAGQLNADEHLDLAVLCLGHPGSGVPWPGSGLTVLFGNASGSFGTSPLLSTTVYHPQSLDACDLDDDADLDLLVYTTGSVGATSLRSARLEVFLNDGDGRFSARIVTELSSQGLEMRCGEINGDGLPDVIVPHGSSSVVLFLPGRGDGTFGKPTHFETGPEPWAVDLGDFDGDGEPDLAAVHRASNDAVLLLNRCALPVSLTMLADRSTLLWTPACVAESYEVRRGARADLLDESVDVPASERVFFDESVPETSRVFFYRVVPRP